MHCRSMWLLICTLKLVVHALCFFNKGPFMLVLVTIRTNGDIRYVLNIVVGLLLYSMLRYKICCSCSWPGALLEHFHAQSTVNERNSLLVALRTVNKEPR